MLTRPVSERRFFLTPSKVLNQIVVYALAYAAMRHGVQIHHYTVLSNHLHIQLTDVFGNLREFARDLNRLIAKAGNARLKRLGHFWDNQRPSYVRLEGEKAVWTNATYILTNA